MEIDEPKDREEGEPASEPVVDVPRPAEREAPSVVDNFLAGFRSRL